jgi:hypothetical protein
VGGVLNDAGPGLTGLATALLAYVTYRLFQTAGAQAEITRDMHRARRAFVFVNQMLPQWERDDKGDPIHTFRVQWGNGGDTQTVGMRTSVNAEFIDHPLPDDFDFGGPSAVTTFAMMGPKSTIAGGSPRSFSTAEMRQIVSRQMYLYLWGWVTYRDAFDGTDGHITRYCYQVVAFGDPAKIEGGPLAFNVRFLFHPKGNCADNECAVQGHP